MLPLHTYYNEDFTTAIAGNLSVDFSADAFMEVEN
jgi:hypothetical protein